MLPTIVLDLQFLAPRTASLTLMRRVTALITHWIDRPIRFARASRKDRRKGIRRDGREYVRMEGRRDWNAMESSPIKMRGEEEEEIGETTVARGEAEEEDSREEPNYFPGIGELNPSSSVNLAVRFRGWR